MLLRQGARDPRGHRHSQRAHTSTLAPLLRRCAGNEGSSTTHGSRSSVQIACLGASRAGSSNEQTVKSTVAESSASAKNKGVPQHAAKLLQRAACFTTRSAPLMSSTLGRETVPQVTNAAALARRQSKQ